MSMRLRAFARDTIGIDELCRVGIAHQSCYMFLLVGSAHPTRGAIGIDELTEVGQFIGGELAGFDEVNGEAAGGAVEHTVDQFADHGAGGGALRDGGGPLMAAARRLPARRLAPYE